MSPPISNQVMQLVRSLFVERSLLDRVRRQDRRFVTLKQIAESREVRVVPTLLPLLTTDEVLALHVAAVIAELARDVTPIQLSWLDEQVRRRSYAQYWSNAWHKVAPAAVSRLAQTYDLNAAAVGLLASHANGFVRAAALEVLAQFTSGQEIPFISLRANDWVDSVAARATELLIDRLKVQNRQIVLTALPFIVRVLGQHRRDHSDIVRALKSVLLSDGGEDAIARGEQFDTSVRRKMYELLTADSTASKRQLFKAALTDPDAVIRARAIRSLAMDAGFEDRAAIVERLVHDDPVPAVRRLALTLLSEQVPERIAGVFPEVLLDRAASVRGVARFVAVRHHLGIIPRAVYVQALVASLPGQLRAAIEGIGETGTRADADLIDPFLSEKRSRIRRSALRAIAKLDQERAISAAIAALADDASVVRSEAVGVIALNANRVDFDAVSRRVRSLSAPMARGDLLRVYLDAPKWQAPVLLLEMLTDSDDGVRALAVRHVDQWIRDFNKSQTQPTSRQLQRIEALLDSLAARMPEQTARMLRFSIKPL